MDTLKVQLHNIKNIKEASIELPLIMEYILLLALMDVARVL